MTNIQSINIPYEPVEDELPIEDKHYTRAEIWWRLHNNKIVGWIIVCLVLIISYVLICSLPIFRNGLTKTESGYISAGVVNDGTRKPKLIMKDTWDDNQDRANRMKAQIAGISTDTPMVEEANATVSTDEPTATTPADGTTTTDLNMPPASFRDTTSDNLIPKGRLPPFPSEDTENDTVYPMSASRILPSNATDFDPLTLLTYMKMKAIFTEFHCSSTHHKKIPVFKFNVTVSGHTFTGKEQHIQENAKLAAARAAAEALFGIHYRHPLHFHGEVCHKTDEGNSA